MIKDTLREAEEKMKKTLEAVLREFNEIRTGRASGNLVEGIMVACYGQQMALKQLASISVPEPRSLTIQPWDQSIVPEIEKAILKSNLGITPVNDGKFLRLNIPHLTEERKAELVKIAHQVAENGHVSLRTARRDANEDLKKLEKEKKITEDDRFKAQDEVQKLTDKFIAKIDEALANKEKEIRQG